jgi:hypothetical protein
LHPFAFCSGSEISFEQALKIKELIKSRAIKGKFFIRFILDYYLLFTCLNECKTVFVVSNLLTFISKIQS